MPIEYIPNFIKQNIDYVKNIYDYAYSYKNPLSKVLLEKLINKIND